MAMKDWKVMKGSREPSWLNTTTVKHQMLKILNISNTAYKGYTIELYSNRGFIKGLHPHRKRIFSTKTAAVKYAKAYMRSH